MDEHQIVCPQVDVHPPCNGLSEFWLMSSFLLLISS